MRLSRVHKFENLVPSALGVVVAVLTGCSSGPTEPIVNDRIFGVWEWVRAEGGIAGDTITPVTEGFTMALRITRPDRIELFRDGVTQVDTRFDFIPAQDLDDISNPPRLRYDEPLLGRNEQFVFASDDELILQDDCCDGFIYFWLARLE
jgi:hypothetical protein